MNSVQLIGNLVRDPERRNTASEVTVARLRIAVNGRRRNKAGDWVDKANYFDVTVFGQQADNALGYLATGRKVAVTGRLDYQEWKAQDGTTRSKVEVIANEVDYLTPAKRGGDDRAATASEPAPASEEETAPAPQEAVAA